MAVLGVCTIVLTAAASSLVRAAQRPLWYDEIYTLVLSKLDTMPALWSALQDAVDTNPPPYYILTGVAAQLPLEAELSVRLPSTIAFVVYSLCLFFVVRPMAGTQAGLIAAVLPLATPVYDPYAIQARPYTLLCATLAIALLCWQRADRPLFAMLFACALGFAMSLHYYAIFSLCSFVAGEAIVACVKKSFRVQVWLAILVGMLPLIVFWPLVEAIRAYYADGFWSKPQLEFIPQSYDTLLFLHANLSLAFALLLVVAVAFGKIDPGLAGVVGVLLLSPALMTIAAKLVGAGMSDRYALAPLVTGAAVGTAMLAARMRSLIVSSVLALFLVAFFSSAVRAHNETIEANLSQYHLPENWLRLADDTGLPIVVSDGVFYLSAYQYGSNEQRERLMTVVDPPSALNYVNTDSVDRNLMALRKYLPIRAEDFQDFARDHAAFLLLSPHDSNGDYFDWWQRRLADDGYALRVEAIRNRQVLYLAQR